MEVLHFKDGEHEVDADLFFLLSRLYMWAVRFDKPANPDSFCASSSILLSLI